MSGCQNKDTASVKVVAYAQIPKCPHCGKFCNPAGGATDGSEIYWACLDCKFEVDDIIATEVKPLNLNP